MDPRLRADQILARAQARGAFVVTPDSATSPMDASSTVRIPRELVTKTDSESTAVIAVPGSPHNQQSQPSPPQNPRQHQWPSAEASPQPAWPQNDYGHSGYGQQHAPQPPQHNPHGWVQLGAPQYPPPHS